MCWAFLPTFWMKNTQLKREINLSKKNQILCQVKYPFGGNLDEFKPLACNPIHRAYIRVKNASFGNGFVKTLASYSSVGLYWISTRPDLT